MTLLDISSWWQAMSGFEKIFWGIALLFSILFVIQSVLSFIGGDGAETMGDADATIAHDGGMAQGFFTLQNMVAFFTIFGWTGIAMIKGGASKAVVLIVALAAGVGIVILMMLLFRSMSKLRQSGTLQIKNAQGIIAETYLVIPSQRNGFGKVHIKIQGSLHELQAITDDEQDIATGKLVKVLSIMNHNVLVVTSKLS